MILTLIRFRKTRILKYAVMITAIIVLFFGFPFDKFTFSFLVNIACSIIIAPSISNCIAKNTNGKVPLFSERFQQLWRSAIAV